MNHYRTFYNRLLEVKFSMMEFKLRNNTAASYQAMEALTDAIKEADSLAGIMEMSEYEAWRAFEKSNYSSAFSAKYRKANASPNVI